jgi:hypothetical protein
MHTSLQSSSAQGEASTTLTKAQLLEHFSLAQLLEHFSWEEITRLIPTNSMENELQRREQEAEHFQKKREKKAADKAANKLKVEAHLQKKKENEQSALAL